MPETQQTETVTTQRVKRLFKHDNDTWVDPDPFMSEDDVVEALSVFKPELACGYIKERRPSDDDDDTMIYELGTNIGTKS